MPALTEGKISMNATGRKAGMTVSRLMILLSYHRGTEEIDSRNCFYIEDRKQLVSMGYMQMVARDADGNQIFQLTSLGIKAVTAALLVAEGTKI
jgi:hypothetical protein